MANNLKVFNTNSEYQSAELVYPAVSYVVESDKVIYDDAPPSPSFQGKWLATYTGGTVASAECDSSTVIKSFNKTDLVELELGDCVTGIGNGDMGGVFSSCSTLERVKVGSGMTSIGSNAFYGCKNLESFTIEATTPPKLGNKDVFRGGEMGAIVVGNIYVPFESLDAYKTDRGSGSAMENYGWSDYADRIQAIQ